MECYCKNDKYVGIFLTIISEFPSKLELFQITYFMGIIGIFAYLCRYNYL